MTGSEALVEAARLELAAVKGNPVIEYHQSHAELLAAFERIAFMEEVTRGPHALAEA